MENELYPSALALDAEERVPLRSHVVAAYRKNLAALRRLILTTPDIDCTQIKTDPSKYANLLPEWESDDVAITFRERVYAEVPKFGPTTLLHVVSSLAQSDMVHLILAKGGDVEAIDFIGRTPLHRAAFRGHTAVLDVLICAGADVSAFTQRSECLGNWLPIPPLRAALHYATWQGHVSAVQVLLRAKADPSVAETDGWRCPLLYAIDRQNRGLVKLLLDAGADPFASDFDGVTALHSTSSINIARLSLAACPDLHKCRDHRGRTPLDSLYGVPSKPQDFCVFLIKYSGRMGSTENFPRYLLHNAAEHGHDRAVKALLGIDPNFLQIVTLNNETALHYTAGCAYGAQCAEILINAGIDVFRVTVREQNTALHRSREAECARILIEAGIDVSQTNTDGNTALHLIAGRRQKGDIASVFVAESSIQTVSARNKKGETALHIAVKRSNEGMVKLLLSSGIAVSIQDNEGYTPLHKARSEEVITQLVAASIDVNLQTFAHKTTALHCRTLFGSPRLVKLLLRGGADVNLQNTKGDTALYGAVALQNEEMIELLLSHGADPSIQNKYGLTALHSATRIAAGGCRLTNTPPSYDRDKMATLAGLINDDATISSESISLLQSWQLNAVKVARLLLAFEADPSLRDSNGYTAMEIFGLPASDIQRAVEQTYDILMDG